MAIPLTINGAVFEYPQNFDEDWGVNATGWAQAVTAGALYLSGGSFPLTNTVDFGSSFGMKVKSITSKTVNPATSGYLLLAKTDAIEWRNNANSGNLSLGIDGSNNLTFNGAVLGTTSLTNTHIFVGNGSNLPTDVAMSGDATIANTGVLTIANSAITNAKVSTSAAIALSKLATLAASRAVQSGTGGLLEVSTVTTTELGYLSGVTSSIQSQLNTYLPLAGGTMSGAISMASHKITAVTSGSVVGDVVQYGQWIGGQTPGTSTNDDATLGNVGEYVSAYANGVNAAASGAWNDLTSISLTAGDWDVTLVAGMNAIITFDSFGAGISTTPGNSTAGLQDADNSIITTVTTPNPGRNYVVIPVVRFSLASTTTIYAKQTCNYGAGSPPQGRGRLSARRTR